MHDPLNFNIVALGASEFLRVLVLLLLSFFVPFGLTSLLLRAL